MKESSASKRTTERTAAQENNFRRLLRDIADHAATVVLDRVKADRKDWQRVIEKGDELREVVTDAVISAVAELPAARLRYIKSVPVPVSEDLVITKELLRRKYNIGWFGENFRRHCFGKIMKAVPAGTITIHELKEYSTNQQLKDELGDQAVLPLAYMLSLIEKQSKGEPGPLFTNGYANLIIVEVEEEVEQDGKKVFKKTLWVVSVNWHAASGYWSVEANSLGNPNSWHAGALVFSRDS